MDERDRGKTERIGIEGKGAQMVGMTLAVLFGAGVLRREYTRRSCCGVLTPTAEICRRCRSYRNVVQGVAKDSPALMQGPKLR